MELQDLIASAHDCGDEALNCAGLVWCSVVKWCTFPLIFTDISQFIGQFLV